MTATSWACLVLAAAPLAAQSAKPWPDIIEANGKAVVVLASLDPEGNYIDKSAGFLAGPNGLIVTAYQAIAEASGVEVILSDGKKTRDVRVVATDPRKDIALLRIANAPAAAVELGNSDATRAGDAIVLLSRPQGTFVHATTGTVSAIRDSMRGLKLHQVQMPVNRTGIGGPALNDRGAVVGVVSTYRLFNENIGFFTPINYVRGMIDDQPGVDFASFLKTRKPYQPFDPAVIEAQRLAVIDKVRVTTFQVRDKRVRWEQINEVVNRLRQELVKDMNQYGSTPSEVLLADPFEVAEHRRLIAGLYFNFGEIFSVGDVDGGTLIPLTHTLLSAMPRSAIGADWNLLGKKGETKGKVSKTTLTYGVASDLVMPMVLGNPAANFGTMRLAAMLSRLVSNEEMPNLTVSLRYVEAGSGKDKVADSLWSQDAFNVPWSQLKDRRLWDVQDKIRDWKSQAKKEQEPGMEGEAPAAGQ